MADTLETLQIELTAKVDQLQASLDSVSQKLSGVSSNAEKAGTSTAEAGAKGAEGITLLEAAAEKAELRMAGVAEEAGLVGLALADLGGSYLIAGAAIGALAIGVEKSIEAFADAETASVRLNAVLAATGASSGQTAQGIEAYADSVSKSTTFTKDQVESAATTLLQFQGITGDTFGRVMEVAENLSAATGKDLTGSLIAVARATQDPINGMEALRRAGSGLTDQQMQFIGALAQSGDKLGAQNALLDDLAGKSGNTATALGSTLSGSVDHLSVAFTGLETVIGKILSLNGGLASFIQGTANQINNLTDAVSDVSEVFAKTSSSGGGNGFLGAAAGYVINLGGNLARYAAGGDPSDISGSISTPGKFAAVTDPAGSAAAGAGLSSDNLTDQDWADLTGTGTVASDASATGLATISQLQQEISLQNEDAAARAGDLAVMKLQEEEKSKNTTASAAEIAQVRSLAIELYNATTARKADTAEAKKAADESDELTKSLNEALITAQKQGDDIGLTDIEKATVDANAQVAKMLAAAPLLHGVMTTQQQDTANQIIATEQQTAASKDLYAQYEATLTPLEKYDQTMKELGEEEPFAKTPQQLEAIQRATDNANDSMNALKSTFDSVASGVTEDFDKTFTDILENGTISFKSIAQTFYDTFAEMLAKMAVLAIASPVIVPIVESLGTSLGVSQTGINSELTSLGLAGLKGQTSTGAGSSFSLAGLLGTSLLGSGSLAASIDQFGANNLGIGTTVGGAAAGDAGTVVGGVSSLATIGNAVGGFAGSELGNLAFGNTGTAGTVASLAGGLGGAALATGSGAIGTAIGGALGSWAGPVGAAVGAFAGEGIVKAVSGLFGGKPSDMTEAGEASLASNAVTSTSGATSGSKYSAANSSERDSLLSFATSLSSTLASTIGTTLSNQLTVKIGSRDGSSYTIWGQAETDFDNTTDGMKDLAQSLVDLYAASGNGTAEVADLNTAIKNIDFSNATQALSDLQFAANFESLMDSLTTAAPVVSTVDTEVANLNTTFDTYRSTADRLGLSLDKVNTAYQAQMKILQNDFLSSYQDTALNDLLPGYSDLASENASYTQSLADAATLGLNNQQIAEITLEHQLTIKSLLAQNNTASQAAISNATTLVSTYSNLSDGFASLLDELNTGDLSTASPTATLDDLRSQVESVGAQAQGGDTDAQNQLLTLIPEFLKQSATVNGYDTDYAADQAMATTLAESAKSVADQQLTVQQNILNAANDQTSLLEQIAGTGTSGNANDKLVAAIKAGYTGLTDDQISAIFESAGVTVAPGGGARTAALNGNSATNTELNDVFHALGVPGFATGGSIGMGGGKPGVDSVPLLAMPGEFVMRAKAVAALGTPTLNYMNATGSVPANDNGGSSDMASRLDRLTEVVYAGQKMMTDHLKGIRTSTARTANAAGAM